MEEFQDIERMLSQGKINPTQAELLKEALKETGKRAQRIKQYVGQQKERREAGLSRVLGGFFLLMMAAVAVLLFFISSSHIGKNSQKALAFFNEAGVYLDSENYEKTIALLETGIRYAPQEALGYSLLGSTYRLYAQQTNQELYRVKEKEAFGKFLQLKEDSKKERGVNMPAMIFAMIFILLVVAAVSGFLMVFYNLLVRKEEKVSEALGQVAAQYQRRLDLIPALTQIPKEYAQHEASTLIEVAEARQRAQGVLEKVGEEIMSGEKGVGELQDSQLKLKKGISQIFALVEKYPDLKANVHFLTLQNQIEGTENKIAEARDQYNRMANEFNSALRCFPANIVAALLQFKTRDYFAQEGDKS